MRTCGFETIGGLVIFGALVSMFGLRWYIDWMRAEERRRVEAL